MSDEKQRYLTDAGMAFFGAITASVSHELNNVISIIDQTAGLLDDMIAGDEQGVPLTIDRLTNAVALVQKQTERGLQIIKRLNRFAHSADQPLLEFEVGEVLDNLVALCQRLASLKKASIELRPAVEATRVTSNPFFMQEVLFRLVKLALQVVQPEDRLEVGAAAGDGRVAINIDSQRAVAISDEQLSDLNLLAAQIEGAVSADTHDTGTRMTLDFPVRQATT